MIKFSTVFSLIKKRSIMIYQLEFGDVFLPPEIFLDLRPECCQEVVRVHDDMNKGVEESDQNSLLTCKLY
jgi:hypothetical protein